MNAPAKIEATKTLAREAREILAEAPVSRLYEDERFRQDALKTAAQFYLDNLADGYDCPDELAELLAAEEVEAEPTEEDRINARADYLYDMRGEAA